MSFKLKVENPKRNAEDFIGRASLYPYYAGFSASFAYSLLSSACLDENSCLLDPWNGGGTTTVAALSLGLSAQGYDLNPAMVVIAKARMLSNRVKNSLLPLTKDILSKSIEKKPLDIEEHDLKNDPLSIWFRREGVLNIRKVEKCIKILLVDGLGCQDLRDVRNINSLSDLVPNCISSR